MNIDNILPAGGVDALAAQLGIPRDQAQRGAQALLPSLLAGMGDRSGKSGAGSQDLEQHFNTLGGAGLADNVVGAEPTEIAKGNELLGGIFGSKDTSRQVATQASQQSGLDPSLLKQMLPILAMLVAGHLAKQGTGQSGGIGGILTSVVGSMVGGGGAAAGAGQGGLGGILNSVLGGSRH